jgi:hypothetical protein
VHIYGNAVNGPSYPIIGGETGSVQPAMVIYAQRFTNQSQSQNSIRIDYNLGIRMHISLLDGDDSLTLIGNTMTSSTDLDTGGGTNDVYQFNNSLGNFTWHNLA